MLDQRTPASTRSPEFPLRAFASATSTCTWLYGPEAHLAAAGEVESFVEKPSGDRLEVLAHASKHATAEFPFEASMGIYVFKCAPFALPAASPCRVPGSRPRHGSPLHEL